MSQQERTRDRSDAATPPGGLVIGRRRLLGGALAGALAAVLLGGERLPARPGPSRWQGKTRWIGHC